MLTDNPWEGGGAFTYEQVGDMTPDQVYHRLCDKKVLKQKGGRRIVNAAPGEVVANPDGMIKGVAEDGTKIVGRIVGKSLARQLMEQEAAKAEAERKAIEVQKGRRRRRGRKG